MKATLNKPALAWMSVSVGACWFLFGCASTSGGSNDKPSGQEPPKVFVAPTPAPVAPVPAASQTPAQNQQQTAAGITAKPPPAPPPSAPPKASASELEKLVMPIALHPD